MIAISYQIKLEEPGIFTDLDGDPNSSISLGYIPGSVLRGAILAKFMRLNHLHKIDACDQTIRNLFFDGDVRYLNGYLEYKGCRSLPTPRSLFQEKNALDDVYYDFAWGQQPYEGQWKSRPDVFTIVDSQGGILDYRVPERTISVHTTRNRRSGRPGTTSTSSEEAGVIYRYNALAAGQTFIAMILCSDEKFASALAPCLEGRIKIGGSRNAGYGLASLGLVDSVEKEWHETTQIGGNEQLKAVPPIRVNQTMIITFLSNGLFRDQGGQFIVDPDILTNAIAEKLGCDLVLKKKQVFLQTLSTGGFNRKWGLPLPQELAVKMGSTLVLEQPNCDWSRITQLEEDGIGERRVEGFGRIAVNWLDRTQWQISEIDTQANSDPIEIPEGSIDQAVAKEISARIFQQRLELHLIQLSNKLGQQVHVPKNSQLSRMIEVLQNARQEKVENGRITINQYLRKLGSRQATRDQFKQDTVAGKPLLEWLQFRVNDSNQIWEEIDAGNPPKIGTVMAEMTASLAYELNLRLVIAVLERAIKNKSSQPEVSHV